MQPRGKRPLSPNESVADDARAGAAAETKQAKPSAVGGSGYDSTDDDGVSETASTKKPKADTGSDSDDNSYRLTVRSIHRTVTTALASPHPPHTGSIGLPISPLCRVIAEYAAPFVTTRTEYRYRYRPTVTSDRYAIVSLKDSGECIFAARGEVMYSLSLRPGKSRLFNASCAVM